MQMGDRQMRELLHDVRPAAAGAYYGNTRVAKAREATCPEKGKPTRVHHARIPLDPKDGTTTRSASTRAPSRTATIVAESRLSTIAP